MLRVGYVVFPGFQVMGFTAITAFEIANSVLGDAAYRITLLSETGGLVPTSAGFCVDTRAFGSERYDTVVIGASTDIEASSPAVLRFVQRSLKSARRLAGPCTGAFVLAQAGVLNGRRATTHWLFAKDLRDRFPHVTIDEDRIYVIDGPVWTSAGMTATIDLALAMIETDHGPDVARATAQKLVVYHRRAGGQSQFSALLEIEPKSDRIQRAVEYARRNLQNELSVEELAEVANLSVRQFSRAFHAETGQSPAKAVEQLRVEAARMMVEEGRHTLDVIADETGFADRERMRRAFLRVLGQPPQAIRRNARGAA